MTKSILADKWGFINNEFLVEKCRFQQTYSVYHWGTKKKPHKPKNVRPLKTLILNPQTGKFSQNIFDENMFYFIEKSFSTCSSMSVYVFCTRNSNNTESLSAGDLKALCQGGQQHYLHSTQRETEAQGCSDLHSL